MEGVCKDDHPALADLIPINGSIKDKFYLNAYGFDGVKDIGLCLRAARVNHSCRPNACPTMDTSLLATCILSTKAISR